MLYSTASLRYIKIVNEFAYHRLEHYNQRYQQLACGKKTTSGEARNDALTDGDRLLKPLAWFTEEGVFGQS